MMKKTVYVLLLLLAIQVGLVVMMQTGDSDLDAESADDSFFSFTGENITSLLIRDNEGNNLTLSKSDALWRIEEAAAAPADASQLNALLDKLSSARVDLAVTISAGSAKRFKTAADDFERHVLLKAGEETVADFYLGTSAGFRHSHVRKAGEKSVFSLPVSDFEFSVQPADWLDNNLARIDRDALQRVEYEEVLLVREDDAWVLNTGHSGEADGEQIKALLDSLTTLTVQDIYPAEEVSSLFADETDLSYRLNFSDDTSKKMALAEYDDAYVLKMSDSDLYFKVESWQVDKIREFNLEKPIRIAAESTDTGTQDVPESP